MPKILTDCVAKLKAQGHSESESWAICQSSIRKALAKKGQTIKGERIVSK